LHKILEFALIKRYNLLTNWQLFIDCFFILYVCNKKGNYTMIENEVKTNTKVKADAPQSNSTSPISSTYDKKASKANAFLAWLNDEDVVNNEGAVSAKTAAVSYAKGLVEIVKTIYKKPLLSAVTIAIGAGLTFYAQFSALVAVMSLSIAAGIAGIGYAVYTIANRKSTEATKQAYEILGISTFILALGVYGLLM